MDELFFRTAIDDEHEIWISEISRTAYDANELEDLGTDAGYFLLIGSRKPGGSGATILAKVASEYAAVELFRLLTRNVAPHRAHIQDSRYKGNNVIARLGAN